MNFNKLFELLLEKNAASWNGKKWIETTEENMSGLWVNYFLSLYGGPQFNIYNNEFNFMEFVHTVDELKDKLKKIK